MNMNTIFKSSMRKMKNAKSEGEMKRIISEFDRECDKYVRQLHSYQDELFARLREWRWANEK